MTVRLATYNLLHGVPVRAGVGEPVRDGAGRVVGPPLVEDDRALRAAVAQLGADVLGLQEVDVDQPRSGHAHQVHAVAEALDAPFWRFAPSVVGTPGEDRWRAAGQEDEDAANPRELTSDLQLRSSDQGTVPRPPLGSTTGPLYGVGLVSRLPVLSWRTTRLEPAPWSLPLLIPAEPRPRFIRVPDEPRAAIAAVVQGPRTVFTVATAHLSFVPGYNVRQLRELRRWLAGMPRPLVLLGDFNLPGSIPARVTGWTPLARGRTYPSTGPRIQFDHVLADGLTAHQQATAVAQIHLLPVSDHAAVSVDVDF
jgi:endonuclease/exonuclease/phosphatase family metal-dependent hydrolase